MVNAVSSSAGSARPDQTELRAPSEAALPTGEPASAELGQPDYSTDDFRMFAFKVVRCSKRYVHDWRTCPYAHPTENARRRDPRENRYLAIPCPEYKKGICMLGDACPYAHGVYECWLHPSKFRTQLCKDGEACRRPVCFFAHSQPHLRQAVTDFNPTPEELERCERLRAQHQQTALLQSDSGRPPRHTVPDAAPSPDPLLQSAFSLPAPTLPGLSAAPSCAASSGVPTPGRLSLDAALGAQRAYNTSDLYVDVPQRGVQQPMDVPAANLPTAGSPGLSGSPSSSRSSLDTAETATARQLGLGGNPWSGPPAVPPPPATFEGAVPSGPRMSNALARKLGLAPQREAKARNAVAPPSAAAAAAAAAAESFRVQALAPHVPLPAAPHSIEQQQQLAALMQAGPADPFAPAPLGAGADPQQLSLLMELVANLQSLNMGPVPAPASQYSHHVPPQQAQHIDPPHSFGGDGAFAPWGHASLPFGDSALAAARNAASLHAAPHLAAAGGYYLPRDLHTPDRAFY